MTICPEHHSLVIDGVCVQARRLRCEEAYVLQQIAARLGAAVHQALTSGIPDEGSPELLLLSSWAWN